MRRPCLLTVLVLFGIFPYTILSAQQLQKLYINPKNPAVQKQSNFVDLIRFIPLQTVDGAVINNGEVIQTTGYFILTDFSTKNLYFYSKDGTFLRKLNFKGPASNLYPVYRPRTNELVFWGNNPNYTLTPRDKVKISLDAGNKRNLKYFRKYVLNLNDTSFVIRKSQPDKYDIIGADPLFDDQFMYTKVTTSSLYPDSTGYEFTVFPKSGAPKNYFPYNRINEPAFLFTEDDVSTSLTDTPHVAYLMRPYRDTIYKLVKDSLYPAYQLVLPLENSIPAGFFTRALASRAERDNFNRNNGWMFNQVMGFHETPRLIYITIRFSTRFDGYIYDKNTKTAFSISKIKADPAQYNLQVLLTSMNPFGNRFYKMIKADKIAAFFKENPGTPVPPALASVLNDANKNAALIVEYKLKD